MKYIVYCVKDEQVAFNNPFYLQDNGRADMIAIRSFKSLVKSGKLEETAIDCNLYKIGTFDNNTAMHKNYRFPEVLITGKEILTEIENEVSKDV